MKIRIKFFDDTYTGDNEIKKADKKQNWIDLRSRKTMYIVIQTNHMGIIDETYCGDTDEWCMPVYATRDTEIKAGDRVCQFRIVEHQPDFDFEVVDMLNNDSRGGFGSTGKA